MMAMSSVAETLARMGFLKSARIMSGCRTIFASNSSTSASDSVPHRPRAMSL